VLEKERRRIDPGGGRGKGAERDGCNRPKGGKYDHPYSSKSLRPVVKRNKKKERMEEPSSILISCACLYG